MGTLFDFFWNQRGGMFVALISIAAIVYLIRAMAWTFQWGRYSVNGTNGLSTFDERERTRERSRDSKLTFVVADFFVKLINDFRHLLALVLVLVFACVLAYALFKADSAKPNSIADALQGVMATLGGLIGSIVGYYFGESAGRKSRQETSLAIPASEPQQGPPVEGAEVPPIAPAPQPPSNF